MNRPYRHRRTGPQRRVVIADAEPVMQQQLQAVLPRPQYRPVGVADTATQAVRLAYRRRPDVLIVDIQMTMEKTDSREGAVRPTPDGPVLIVTAYSHHEIAAYGNMAGIGAYVIKPVRVDMFLPILEITIARVAEVRAMRRDLVAERAKLEEHDVVTRAKRFLMRTHALSEAEAYRRLRKRSMDTRLRLRDVAVAVLAQAPAGDEVARWAHEDVVNLSA